MDAALRGSEVSHDASASMRSLRETERIVIWLLWGFLRLSESSRVNLRVPYIDQGTRVVISINHSGFLNQCQLSHHGII